MDLLLITPVSRSSRKGNRITTDRWERILRRLGHEVTVEKSYSGQECDLLIALHARRSSGAIKRFHNGHPEKPIVLALTGTDVYRDIHRDDSAVRSLEIADRFVVLQPEAIHELPENLMDRARVIYQSVTDVPGRVPPREDVFEVSVIGHLREIKDPFRAERASRTLPERSNIEIVHAGGVLEEDLREDVERATRENSRYRWVGEKPRAEALRILARSRLLVHSSTMEGGAHVISEAIACNTPVLASEISGNIGLLGNEYTGYFPVKDTETLRELLLKAEHDREFYRSLKDGIEARSNIVSPKREEASWRDLLEEFR